MTIFQHDNVKIHQAQIVKEWFWAWRIISTHESAPLSPDLKFIESLWDVLEETFQSAGLLHCQYKILSKKCMHLLMEITSQHLFLLIDALIFVLTMQESSTL